MSRHKLASVVCLTLCVPAGLLALAGCGGDGDDGGGVFHCSYEERRTSCGSSSFGPWEAGCSTVDFELREGLTRQDFCDQAYPPSDTECGGGCCLSFQFRNVSVGEGACSGNCASVPTDFISANDGCDCPMDGDTSCDPDCSVYGNGGGGVCGCDFCY